MSAASLIHCAAKPGMKPAKPVNPLTPCAGITNYIDIGLQVATDVLETPGGGNGTNGPERLGAAPGSAAIGAMWQVFMPPYNMAQSPSLVQ